MSSKRSNPAETVELSGDDFRQIRGIGPEVAVRLQRAGITTFAKLAALSPADIVALLNDVVGLSTNRINKQDWIGQARELAELQSIQVIQAEEVISTDNSDYVTFTLELLLDEDSNVRQTRLVHHQSQRELSWEGWNARQLTEAVANSAALRLRITSEEEITSHPVHLIPSEISPKVEPTVPEFQLERLELISEKQSLGQVLQQDQPFKVRLTLVVDKLEHTSYEYHARVYAKSLEGLPRRILGESTGTVHSGKPATVEINAIGLSEGTYRLEATVALNIPQPGPKAMLEGTIVQVY